MNQLRNDLRVLVLGGWSSYRALFGWLTPWILIPTFLVTPVFQILFFAFVGRDAGVGDDTFYLIGNAIQLASSPCLFAMGITIEGERNTQTLGLILVSPARRVPLFLGRAIPVVVNGFVCSLVALTLGAVLLRVSLPWSSMPLVAVTIAVASFSCTGLGLAAGAISLRVRDSSVLSNIIMGLLVIFCGVNVALADLPSWVASVGSCLPLTHAIEAARELVAGAPWSDVVGLVTTEALIGAVYLVIGLVLVRVFELDGRRRASLELV